MIRPGDRGLRYGTGAGAIGHLPRLGQQVEHAVEAREVVLELRHAGGQHGHRLQEHGQVDQEHHQVAHREPAVDDLKPAVEQQRHRGHRQEELPEQLDQPRQPPDVDLQPGHEVVLAHEPGGLAPLPAEGPHHAHPAEDLGRLAVDLLALLADVAEQAGGSGGSRSGPSNTRPGTSKSAPSSSRQSTQARTTSPPRNWTTAAQGL